MKQRVNTNASLRKFYKINLNFVITYSELQLLNINTTYFDKLTFNDYKMASLPQAAFVTCKIHQQFTERDLLIARMKYFETEKSSTDNQQQREYTPAKYNSKLMNSIWGLYNRYSPHNVKKNEFVPPKY